MAIPARTPGTPAVDRRRGPLHLAAVDGHLLAAPEARSAEAARLAETRPDDTPPDPEDDRPVTAGQLAVYALCAGSLAAALAWLAVALLQPPYGPVAWLALTLVLGAAGGFAAPAVLRQLTRRIKGWWTQPL